MLCTTQLWPGAGQGALEENDIYRSGVGRGEPVPGTLASSSGKPVSDRIRRERQALIERNRLLRKAVRQEIARVNPSCCGTVTPKRLYSFLSLRRNANWL
jgi:hypothetical protein